MAKVVSGLFNKIIASFIPSAKIKIDLQDVGFACCYRMQRNRKSLKQNGVLTSERHITIVCGLSPNVFCDRIIHVQTCHGDAAGHAPKPYFYHSEPMINIKRLFL